MNKYTTICERTEPTNSNKKHNEIFWMSCRTLICTLFWLWIQMGLNYFQILFFFWIWFVNCTYFMCRRWTFITYTHTPSHRMKYHHTESHNSINWGKFFSMNWPTEIRIFEDGLCEYRARIARIQNHQQFKLNISKLRFIVVNWICLNVWCKLKSKLISIEVLMICWVCISFRLSVSVSLSVIVVFSRMYYLIFAYTVFGSFEKWPECNENFGLFIELFDTKSHNSIDIGRSSFFLFRFWFFLLSFLFVRSLVR